MNQPLTTGFAKQVIAWQLAHGRHQLPWQNTRDPYRVWLSEIMLQQTQVATVLVYYSRFLQRFPDVSALAAASLDEILALWSGLGYYARASNLHRCAQEVARECGGYFPRNSAQLAQLPGIGRSTAAAIATLCYGERVAILDGNVKRVLTRVLGFASDLSISQNEQTLWAKASALLPIRRIEAYTQGLMDLGASVCTARNPRCPQCPIERCVARQRGTPECFPVRARKLARTQRENWWLWIEWRGKIWLQQRPATGVWANLWTLPLLDSQMALHALTRSLGVKDKVLPTIKHSLTHFDWLLHCHRTTLKRKPEPALLPCGQWILATELSSIALPAPLRRMLNDRRTALSRPESGRL